MRLAFRPKRDFLAGGLMILIGSYAAVQGSTYNVGTLMRMGPGFMPVALGVLLVLLGIAIACGAVGESDEPMLKRKPEWFAWGCILAGPLAFIGLGYYGGLAPATFACVFISAMGDRGITWKAAFLLALGTTVCGVILFVYLLGVPFPVFRWGQ